MRYVKESRFRAPVEALFGFHERGDVLDLLTPPGFGVEVTSRAVSLETGSRTRFRVRVLPRVWLSCEAEHTGYEKGRFFEDTQIRGPFRRWRHRHFFTPDGPQASVLRDEIEFEPPLGALGRLFAPLFVTRRLDAMFKHRHDVTRRELEKGIP